MTWNVAEIYNPCQKDESIPFRFTTVCSLQQHGSPACAPYDPYVPKQVDNTSTFGEPSAPHR